MSHVYNYNYAIWDDLCMSRVTGRSQLFTVTYYHATICLPSSLFDGNAYATCLVWYPDTCWRTTGDTAELTDNEGPEIDGQKRKIEWKCQTWKWQTKSQDRKLQDRKMQNKNYLLWIEGSEFVSITYKFRPQVINTRRDNIQTSQSRVRHTLNTLYHGLYGRRYRKWRNSTSRISQTVQPISMKLDT